MDPIYKHDCKACVYLGEYRAHDLYYCNPHGVSAVVVVARFSDNPADFVSGVGDDGSDAILAVAHARVPAK